MTLHIQNDVLMAQVMQEMRRVNKSVRALANEEVNNKRNISSLSAEEIIVSAIENNQYSVLAGVVGAISSATDYLQLANSGLQEQQTLMQQAIALVNQYIGDIGVQTAASTAQLNAQLQVILGQIQTVTNVVQTVNGNDILSYVVAPFAESTALPCVDQLNVDASNVNSIVDNVGTLNSEHLSAIIAAAVLIEDPPAAGAIQISVSAGLYGITNVATQNTVKASLVREFDTLTNITNNTDTSPFTLTSGIVAAMGIIPTINFNATTYISQVVSDCIRVEKLCVLLPRVMVAAGIDAATTLAAVAPIKIIACMTNATGGVTSGNAMVGGITSSSTQYAPPANAACAAFAALLTPAEIVALTSLISNTGALNNNGLVVGATIGTIQVDAIIAMLSQITSFVNVCTGNNLLDVNSSCCIISDCTGATAQAVGGGMGSGTSIGGTIGQWCGNGDGGLIVNGNCAVLTGFADVGGNSPMNQVIRYLVNAVNSFITSTNAAIVAQGPIPTIQFGLNATDTITLNVNNSTLSVLGLNLQNVYLSTATAQAALTSLQNAAQMLASNIANINFQLLQFSSRNDTIYTNLDSLQDQIDLTLDADPVATALSMQSARNATMVAGSLMKLNVTLRSTITSAAQKILVSRNRG